MVEPAIIASSVGAIGGAAVAIGKDALIDSGKEVVQKTVKGIVKQGVSIEKSLREGFKIEGQQITLLCADDIQKYSISLTPTKRSFISQKYIDLPQGHPIRANLYQYRGLANIDALERTDNGIRIDLRKLTRNEPYTLEIEYQIEEKRFIEAFVDRVPQRDIPHRANEPIKQYEMSAQLKHPKVLKQRFSSVNLRDVDFTVDVSVHQDINTKLPGVFKEIIEILNKMSKPLGRDEGFQLQKRLQHLQKSKYGKEVDEDLKKMYELFTPLKFRNYVDVEGFNYADCIRGSEFYEEIPFPTWPKTMKVISKTDLNYDIPAAVGILKYHHQEFVSDIEKVFEGKQ